MEISLEQAEKIAARIEAANKLTEELAVRLEKMRVQEILGGRSEAGNITPEVSKEDKLKDGMKNYFKGSAIEKALK
jgi:hypothetical protein